MASATRPRALLLFTTTGYEAGDFIQAAQQLGIDLVLGSDRCQVLDNPWNDNALPLPFDRPQEAATHIVELFHRQPFDSIVPVGDTPLLTAALASQALGLQHNAPQAATASRNKFFMRQRLQAAGLRVPAFACFPMETDPHLLSPHMPYPCVVKPLALSASRGVMRANTPQEFVRAFRRLRTLLTTPAIRQHADEVHDAILVERFIPGQEVAVEGLMSAGTLQPLALFDKPDPLDGPFFEETLYVTPSRFSTTIQEAIVHSTQQAAQALGLLHGPIHAELRVNHHGPWILELSGRAIGGL